MAGCNRHRTRLIVGAIHELPLLGLLSIHISAYFDVSRLIVINTQILHWRGFDTHIPAYFPIQCTGGQTRDYCPTIMTESSIKPFLIFFSPVFKIQLLISSVE